MNAESRSAFPVLDVTFTQKFELSEPFETFLSDLSDFISFFKNLRFSRFVHLASAS